MEISTARYSLTSDECPNQAVVHKGVLSKMAEGSGGGGTPHSRKKALNLLFPKLGQKSKRRLEFIFLAVSRTRPKSILSCKCSRI